MLNWSGDLIMINYYKADCIYNPREGKNTCSICKHIDECYLVLPYDKEFKYLESMVKYYYERKKEMLKCRKVERYMLYSKKFEKEELEEYNERKKIYDTIAVTEPVFLDECIFRLVNVPGILYVLLANNGRDSIASKVVYEKEHQNFDELKEDVGVYRMLSLKLFDFKINNTDEILKKLIEKLNTKQTIPITEIKNKKLDWALSNYKPISPKEREKIRKKELKQTERAIKEYDDELRSFQYKKFHREKILRRRIKKDIEKGVLV